MSPILRWGGDDGPWGEGDAGGRAFSLLRLVGVVGGGGGLHGVHDEPDEGRFFMNSVKTQKSRC